MENMKNKLMILAVVIGCALTAGLAYSKRWDNMSGGEKAGVATATVATGGIAGIAIHEHNNHEEGVRDHGKTRRQQRRERRQRNKSNE